MCVQFEDFCNISQAHGAVSVEKLWTQNTRIIHDVWRLLILSNEEKRKIMNFFLKEWLWKFWKKGGSSEKGGGGNEIYAPCACAIFCYFMWLNMYLYRFKINIKMIIG
jgi:hypothetical protein